MEDARPQDLLALKLMCDNKTSCEFVNQGGALLGCPEPSEFDYVTVYYRCLPGNQFIRIIGNKIP